MISLIRDILLLFVLFAQESESQAPAITAEPDNPTHVVEGHRVTLQWSYNLSGIAFRQAVFRTSGISYIADKFGSFSTRIRPEYDGLVTANITDTFSSITFLAVTRADSRIYEFFVENDISDALKQVQLIVQFPPSLTPGNGSQVQVVEGDPATFKLSCSADGVPPPNITWTKVFDNSSDSAVLFQEATSSNFVLNNSRSNEGTYRCTADNRIGSAVNHTVSVTVNFKPEAFQLTVNSSNANICRDEIVNFTCSATGKPPVHTYQLFANDSLVDGNSTAGFWSQTLSIDGVFIYSCEANNTVGRTSTTRTVTVNVPSAIRVLSNITVVEGENRSLVCAVSGLPPPASVSWKEVRTGSQSQGDIRQLTNISRNDAGEYTCEASNVCGNDTKSLFLTVHFPPENIQLSASETTICRGSVITLNCSAAGNPMVRTYQLYENDTMLNESSSSGVWNRTLSQGGVFIYRCVANNTVGTANSTHVSVTVNVESEVLPLNNITVVEGENTNLSCVVTGNPVPSVSWTEFRTGIQSQGNIRELTNINRSEAGEYTCVSSNVCGNDTKSLFLTVHFPPENVQLSASETTICRGSVITLNCSADGNPMVDTYQLYENDTMVNESSSSGLLNRTLSQGGVFIYRCEANNTVGTTNSMHVSVTVNEPSSIPVIQNQTLTEFGNLTLTCEASGIPAPSVSWTKVSSGQRTNGSELVLANITRSQAGEYRCEANNACGNASASATIDVQYPPGNVQLQASEETTCLNSTVRFTCSADANPMVLTYQLSRNGTVVGESSSSGVWIRTVSEAGVFVYTCMVNNSLGTGNSPAVSVTVNVPSAIQAIQDEVQEVTEGHNVTIFCNATGIPPPSVSWIKVDDNQHLSANPLVLTNIRRNQTGTYRCEAVNHCANTSKNASIDVQFPPENIQLSASETTVCRGTVITFNCSADANPMVDTYGLYENGTLVNESSSSGVWSRRMLVGGMFFYKCMVTNLVGRDNSTMVSVTVNVPSSILAIQNQTALEGDNLTLTCHADGIPQPFVSWVKASDGQRTNGTELVFSNITRNHAGEYRCEASNPCDDAVETVSIDVEFPPENIQLSANETTVCRGTVITFSCSANANPMVNTYRLYENGTLVNESNSSGVWSRTFSTGGVFFYKCMVTNTRGTENSTMVSVTVNVPSSIEEIHDQAFNESNNSTLTCHASGMPLPSVSWIKVSSGERTNGSELVFTHINRSQAGEYRCEAINPCANASESVTITVQYPPEITHISGQQTLNVGATVTLSCTADGNPTPNITWTRLFDNSVVTMPLTISGEQFAGSYRCTADNGIGRPVTRDTNIIVHFPASIVPLEDKLIFNKSDTVTLFCNVSGKPQPTVMWTHVSTNGRHNNATWVINDLSVNKLGVYRCDASNSYGNASDSVTIEFPGGKCEAKCPGRKTCRTLETRYLCRCEDGKKGDNCLVPETLKETIFVGLKIDQEFKEEYKDLDNPETKRFVARVEEAMQKEMAGTGVTNVRVTEVRPGSVIADVELKFNKKVSQDSVDTLLTQATADGKLGDIDVSEVRVGGSIGATEEPAKECSALFKGPDCKEAKPALIIICVIAGVIVLALLVAIVACSMHKKKSTGRSSIQNGSYAQRQDPEGNGTMDKGFDGTGGRIPRAHYVNNAYEQEPAHQMATFNSNPAQTPGITLNDSSQTQKAQPGEGTYADLGEFHQKAAIPTGPAKRPPAYEETAYAEITQFLKGPIEPDEASPKEEEEVPHEAPTKDDAADVSLNKENNEDQADNLYPRLDDTGGGNEQQAEIVVSL